MKAATLTSCSYLRAFPISRYLIASGCPPVGAVTGLDALYLLSQKPWGECINHTLICDLSCPVTGPVPLANLLPLWLEGVLTFGYRTGGLPERGVVPLNRVTYVAPSRSRGCRFDGDYTQPSGPPFG